MTILRSPLLGAAWLLLAVSAPAGANWLDCTRDGDQDDAADKNKKASTWRLDTHEPNRLGYTIDDSGQFMDFKVSIKFAVFERCVHMLNRNLSTLITFTGRFGQYFERDSSPVIGKRFNPEWVIVRHAYTGRENRKVYYEIAYAHESNGQRVSDLASYLQTQTTLEKPEHARDYISRGWDFYRATVTSPEYKPFAPGQTLQVAFTGKWFQKHGWFQNPEEYSGWENDDEGKQRKRVDGLSTSLGYRWTNDWRGLTGMSALISHTTGYKEPFRYNTVRVEGGVKIIDVPVVLWWAHGYNQDLVRYYNKAKYFGIAVVIENF